MARTFRTFHPAALRLEGRILLAHVHVHAAVPVPVAISTQPAESNVWFVGTPGSGANPQQSVSQGGEAIVVLRQDLLPSSLPFQVQITSDPSSPAVGVNLPAVNQTVTFAAGKNFNPGQYVTSVTIPTTVGAPNPGEVDVNLTITPINPPPGLSVQGGPLELRILAPDSTTPPKIVGVAGTPDGIQLTFNQPMNPAQASNVHNFEVHENWTTFSGNDDFLDITPLAWISPDAPLGGYSSSSHAKVVPLRSASYDPSDFTVTLIPRRKLRDVGSEAEQPRSS